MDNLADRIARDGPVNELDAVGWAIRLAKRLELLHNLGVAHGSVSPACVVTAAADRGAKACLADLQRTPPQFAYQSPERVLGGDLSPADDAWALAATLYALLTGTSPFAGTNDADVRQKILAAMPAPLAVFDVGDDDLQHLLERAFAREIAQRTATVSALRRALEEWHPDPGVSALPALEDDDASEDGEEDGGATMMLQAPTHVSRSIPRIHDDDDDDDVRTVAREFDAPIPAGMAPMAPAGHLPFPRPGPAAGRPAAPLPAAGRPAAPIPAAGMAPRVPASVPMFGGRPAPPPVNEVDEDDDDARTMMREPTGVADEDSGDGRTLAMDAPPGLWAPPGGAHQPPGHLSAPERQPNSPGPAWKRDPLPMATLALPESSDFAPPNSAGPQLGGPRFDGSPPSSGHGYGGFGPGGAHIPQPGTMPAGFAPMAPPSQRLNHPAPPARSSRMGLVIAAIVALLVAAAITFVLLRFRGLMG